MAPKLSRERARVQARANPRSHPARDGSSRKRMWNGLSSRSIQRSAFASTPGPGSGWEWAGQSSPAVPQEQPWPGSPRSTTVTSHPARRRK